MDIKQNFRHSAKITYNGHVKKSHIIRKKKLRKVINSDNAIDAGVDIMLIVFDVLSSPILMVVRILRYAFNKFIRGYVVKGIKWILNKILGIMPK